MRAGPAGPVQAGIERALRLVAGGLAAVGATALAGVFLLVAASVAMRYVWSQPLAFTEELAGLLMTVGVFALLPSTLLGELHIRVTVASGHLRKLPARLFFLFGQLILLVFCWVFVREAWAIAEFTANLNLKSEQSRLPLAPFLFLCTASMALAGVVGAWRAFYPVDPTTAAQVAA